MYYLKPKTNKFFGKERPDLPLIMLWGDEHHSVEGMCRRCDEHENKADIGGGTCYPIYDKRFLKALDKLAAEYPVDFYTEYSKDHEEYGKKYIYTNESHLAVNQVLFKRFLRDTVKDCHRKELRNQPNYADRCPTKAIRWHYSDVRFMTHSFEYALCNPYVIEYNRGEITGFVEWAAEQDGHFSRFVRPFQSLLAGMRLAMYETHDKGLYPEQQQVITELRVTLVKAMLEDTNQSGSSVIMKWANIFRAFTRAGWQQPLQDKYPSVVLKQIRKMDPSLTRGTVIEFLTKSFAYGTSESVQGENVFNNLENSVTGMLPSVRAYLEGLFTKEIDVLRQENAGWNRDTGETTADYPIDPLLIEVANELGSETFNAIWKGIHGIYKYIDEIRTYFHDIYALLRMMKPPQESSTPYLAFGFFGAYHTYRIMSILKYLSVPSISNYFDYEVIYSMDMLSKKKISKRCITIDRPITLAEDLRKHAEAIQAHPAHKVALQKYRDILKREEVAGQTGKGLRGKTKRGGRNSRKIGKISRRHKTARRGKC